MEHFNHNAPIVVGFSGVSGTGKTSTADVFAPQAKLGNSEGPIDWTHLFFALPLQSMVSIRQGIEGRNRRDRILYQLHDVLYDLYGGSPLYGAPPYDGLVEMVKALSTMPCAASGRARQFMQQAGDLLRDYEADTFTHWMRRKILTEFAQHVRQQNQEEEMAELREELDTFDPKFFGVIVSDVRFPNEAEMIKSFENGVLVHFTARPEVIRQRQIERDGHPMESQHQAHKTETSVDLIDPELYDMVIDTSDITIEEQSAQVRTLVHDLIGVNAHA